MKSNSNNDVKILIAEDSPTQRAQLEYLLKEHGYAVVAAVNGKEALAAARQRRPALIISDVVMPELDGYGLCKAIKADEKLKDIPVILVTRLSDSQDVILGLECGADNFICKPYEERYLLSRIEYLLMNLELRKNQKMQMGVEMYLGGEKHFITAERQQILDLLISTYEQAVYINKELKAHEKDLAHSNQMLSGLYHIAEGLNGAVSEREVAEVALERALELPGVQSGWIFLREGESGFRLAAARNLPPALEVPGVLEGDCHCRRQLLAGELGSVTNITECERLGKAKDDTQGLRYHASVPLWLGDRTVGLMNLVGPREGLFDEGALKVLYGVGNQVAVALERARLHEHLESLVAQRTAALISEREALRESENRFRKQSQRLTEVIWGTDIGTWEWNVQTGETVFNERWAEIVGYTLDELAPISINTWSNLVHSDDGKRSGELLTQCFNRESKTYICEARMCHKNGEWVWVSDRGRVVEWTEDGKPLRMSGTHQDITERKQAEAALQQELVRHQETARELFDARVWLAETDRQEAVGRLAAGVAHEVKNPLAIIRLGIDYLSKEFARESTQGAVLGKVQQAITRADSIITDLMQFSRQKPLARHPSPINAVVDNAINLVNHEITSRNIDIVRSYDDSMPPIFADPDQLAQVFVNLLSNAAQAIGQGGRIEVVTRSICLSEHDLKRDETGTFRVGQRVIAVEIRDNGSGVSPDNQEKLFQPFFTTKPIGEGTGLGLAVSRNIVIMHEGSINLFNRPEGGYRHF